jgi:hypothetical protein
MVLGFAGVAVSLVSMLIAALTAKHSVRRDSIRDLASRIATLEGELADCQRKHRAAEERNLWLMEHLVRQQVGTAD